MKSRINKIAKTIAVGVFFMALFFNVKVSLEDPFIQISGVILAQTSSSSSAPETCEGSCKLDPEGTCQINTVDPNGQQIIGICLHMSKR